MIPESRAVALATKSKIYKTKEPCKYGHISNRYTKSGGCVTCVIANARRAKDEQDLKFRGFIRTSLLVHRDDVAALESVAKVLKNTRLAALARPIAPLPPDISGAGLP